MEKVVRVVVVVVGLLGGGGSTARADDFAAQQKLIDESRLVVEQLKVDPKLGAKARALVHKSRAVLAVPELVKAGLIVGGMGGAGVLLARDSKNKWSYPCFYDMGGGSFGLQIGGQVSKVLLIVMNEPALERLLKGKVEFGAGADATVANLEADVEANPNVDIYSVVESEGLFAGATVEGASTSPSKNRNKAYYGRDVSAEDIVLRGVVKNAGTDALRDSLAKF
jgi:lipid-binding SYLF domain-containing protein